MIRYRWCQLSKIGELGEEEEEEVAEEEEEEEEVNTEKHTKSRKINNLKTINLLILTKSRICLKVFWIIPIRDM